MSGTITTSASYSAFNMGEGATTTTTSANGVSSRPTNGSSAKTLSSPKDSRQLHELAAQSPLKIFVLAKRRINDIFTTIHTYVGESATFVNALNGGLDLAEKTDKDLLNAFQDKISGIKDVLSRDHMKVVFFGRTSNGKSTVINAMLQQKILPSGLGHTTNCFLQVEGSPSSEAYLLTDDSEEPKNVESVSQLGNALEVESLANSALVRIFWPKDKCTLLRDDVVLVDSPGIDVSPNLDEWIDKHCLDADVFVLVSNAESTLMVTEKNFFHKVSERLSTPNIFILNNRWDASASEPEIIDKVRKQHLERNVAFLVDELKVTSKEQAEDRVFFVSAREALNFRLRKQNGQPAQTEGLAEGHQSRYIEFEDFERKFEECLSKTAVKTKFEQHTQRGTKVTQDVQRIMEKILEKAGKIREEKAALRKSASDRLEFTQEQMEQLTEHVKQRIGQLVEQVEQQVAVALSEEIRRLATLVSEFERSFHPDPLVLAVYKKELHTYVERGLGSNLRARLSSNLQCVVESSQKEMISRMSALVPSEHHPQMLNALPRHNFEILYRLNCESLCGDFQEDLEFKFSFGIVNLARWVLGQKRAQAALGRSNSVSRPLSSTPQTPSNELKVQPFSSSQSDYLALVSKLAVVSPSSQTAVGALAIGGFMIRTVGWRVIAITASIYALLYFYERMTWTNKAKERSFKKQYVQHATRKLRLIVDLTSANCSHQVQQELSGTFARLGHLVDQVSSDMESEISKLDAEIEKTDAAANNARILRNKAVYLMTELETFSQQFLRYDQ